MDQIIYSEFNQPPYLLEQFRDTEVALLAAVPDRQFQELEAAAQALFTDMWIDSASGKQLDLIGVHVGLLRYGRIDASYRTLLKLKAWVNNTAGTPESLIKVAREIFSATYVKYSQIQPAKVQLLQNGQLGVYQQTEILLSTGDLLVDHTGEVLCFQEPDDLPESILLDLLPSGVGLIIGYEFLVEDEPFLINGEPMYVITLAE